MSDAEPTTPDGVVSAVLALVPPMGRTRLAVDGAPAAEAHALAAAVASEHARAVHVRAEGFWRPAGQRFEYGRHDPDDWLDEFYNGPVFPEPQKLSRKAAKRPDRVAEKRVSYGTSASRRPRR